MPHRVILLHISIDPNFPYLRICRGHERQITEQGIAGSPHWLDSPKGILHPYLSKNNPKAGTIKTVTTFWSDELYPAAKVDVPRVFSWISARLTL